MKLLHVYSSILAMKPHALVKQLAAAIHEFVAPTYRPELHYMRGFGPASARQAVLVESRRMLPVRRDERTNS